MFTLPTFRCLSTAKAHLLKIGCCPNFLGWLFCCLVKCVTLQKHSDEKCTLQSVPFLAILQNEPQKRGRKSTLFSKLFSKYLLKQQIWQASKLPQNHTTRNICPQIFSQSEFSSHQVNFVAAGSLHATNLQRTISISTLFLSV